jgi:hypothetical protein
MKLAAQSQPGLYFAHTDVNGAPAYENALAAAFDAVAACQTRLPASGFRRLPASGFRINC